MSSSLTASFNLKAALRRGHADRRSAHPAHAHSPRTQEASSRCSEFFLGDRIPWGRGPPVRMSSSFTAPFNLKVALCRGHVDRRSAHPANAPSPRTQEASYLCSEFFQGDRTPWVRGPPARMFSSLTASFNLKAALCRGHADRRSAHPAHAHSPRTQEASPRCSEFFQGDRIPWGRGPPARISSSFTASFQFVDQINQKNTRSSSGSRSLGGIEIPRDIRGATT